MCQKRSSVKTVVVVDGKPKWIRVDPCIRHLPYLLSHNGFNIVGCCCSHSRYPLTIVCKTSTNKYYDLISGVEIPRTRNFYRLDSEGFYYIPEVNKLQYNKIEQVSISDMYSLDWKQILDKAVQSRPTSWRVDNPVAEYRNASDCIAQQVIQEMKNKGLIKEK